MLPRYPIYIISKGRAKSRLTSKALEKISVPYRIVIEPQELDEYAAVIDPKKILQLPFSNLGKGSIPALNWVWDHSMQEGHQRHWIMDDNIRDFYRFNKNLKVRVTGGAIFAAAEDFVDRYENVLLAGFQYESLVPRKRKWAPFILNSRVYSCILIQNSCRHRWRGRYNEDTDLSLRVLKDGDCTINFQAFLADKTATMRMTGGNTDQLYKQNEKMDGRLLMAQSLKEQHPDVTTVTKKWGRWQHHVDYRPFKGNRLKRKAGVKTKASGEYGMRLHKKEQGQ